MIGSNTTISIYKMIYGDSTNTYPEDPDTEGVEAYIESQRAEVSQVLGQGYNLEVFVMQCDPIDIDVNDKVVDAQGNEYKVGGVEKHQNNTEIEDLFTVTLNKERNATN